MKYIILKGESGIKYPIVFPDAIVHSDMAEVVKNRCLPEYAEVESAGFCSILATCHGKSESLNVESKESDSLHVSFGESLGYIPEYLIPKTTFERLHRGLNAAFDALAKSVGR